MFPRAGMPGQLHASDKADIEPLLKRTLLSACQVQGAQFGCVQLYDPVGRRLEMAARVGDIPDTVGEAVNEATPWGRAMLQGTRISAGDIRVSVDFAGACSGGGYRAIESTPIIANSGETLGVISVLFVAPHLWTDQELRWTDLSAQLIAEIIDRRRAEEAREASEFRFHSLLQNPPCQYR